MEDAQDTQEDTGSGIIKIKDEDGVHLMTKDDTCLVYKKCLLKLANTCTNVEYSCKVRGCSGPVSHRTENIGSVLNVSLKQLRFRFIMMHFFYKLAKVLYFITKEFTKKHEAHRWWSQLVLNRRLHFMELTYKSLPQY